MYFYISSETSRMIYKTVYKISNEIENLLNNKLGNKTYGNSINKWHFLSIIMDNEFVEPYHEIKKYRKIKAEVELRLQIDYDKVINADESQIYNLICESILRGVELIREKKIKDFNFDEFSNDLIELFKEKGWLV